MQEVSVPIADLRAAGYDAEVERVATAVARYLDDGVGGNVAIISEPYAGREGLLTYVESLLADHDHVERVDLGPGAADGTGPQLPAPAGAGDEGEGDGDGDGDGYRNMPGPDAAPTNPHGQATTASESVSDDASPRQHPESAGAVIAADCHHLFERRIDGFAALDAFLDRIALSDALVVTSWNRYAWSYLDAVRDISELFTTTVSIPRLDATEIETVVDAHFDADVTEVVDTGSAGRVKTVVFGHLSLPLPLPGDRSVAIPYPKPNTAWLASWSVSDSEESVKAVTYEKLRRVSNGNPGVALAVWEASRSDGQIAPGYIEAFEADRSLDDDAAVTLWSILAGERVAVERLTATYPGRRITPAFQDLQERGYVTVTDGEATIRPQALHVAVSALERRGLLW